MFTGIIESIGKVEGVTSSQSNLRLEVSCSFVSELKIDQSLAHNGVCLTVVEITDSTYVVEAIAETLQRTNLSHLKEGSLVNLERCMMMNGRLDGHIVQGHVDQTAVCTKIVDHDGSKEFFFEYDAKEGNVTVEKGSVCVNGVSLTVVHSDNHTFSVVIIPFTLEHTNFKTIEVGSTVNLEFDIIGKYLTKLAGRYSGA